MNFLRYVLDRVIDEILPALLIIVLIVVGVGLFGAYVYWMTHHSAWALSFTIAAIVLTWLLKCYVGYREQIRLFPPTESE